MTLPPAALKFTSDSHAQRQRPANEHDPRRARARIEAGWPLALRRLRCRRSRRRLIDDAHAVRVDPRLGLLVNLARNLPPALCVGSRDLDIEVAWRDRRRRLKRRRAHVVHGVLRAVRRVKQLRSRPRQARHGPCLPLEHRPQLRLHKGCPRRAAQRGRDGTERVSARLHLTCER